MNFTLGEIKSVWSIVAAILHLGNVEFDDSSLDNGNFSDFILICLDNPCKIINFNLAEIAASLLGIHKEELQNSIVYKTREIGRNIIKSPIQIEECKFMLYLLYFA